MAEAFEDNETVEAMAEALKDNEALKSFETGAETASAAAATQSEK